MWYLSADTLAGNEDAVFAAEVGDALAGNLNMRRTLGRIVDLAVPRLGPWAGLSIVDYDRVRHVGRGPGPALEDRTLPLMRMADSGRRRVRQAVESGYDECKISDPADLCDLGAGPDAARALLDDGPVWPERAPGAQPPVRASGRAAG